MRAATTARGKPPVASRTIQHGGDARGAAGRVLGSAPLLSGWAYSASELGVGDSKTTKALALGHQRLLDGPTWQETGSMAPDNGAGSGRSGRDDPGSPTVSTDLRGIGLSRPGSG